jgi:hypothetical protein
MYSHPTALVLLELTAVATSSTQVALEWAQYLKSNMITPLDSIYNLEQEELSIGITVTPDEDCVYVAFENIGDVEQQRRLAHYLYARLKQIPHTPIEVRLTEGQDLIVAFGNINEYADRLNFEQHLKIWLSKLD